MESLKCWFNKNAFQSVDNWKSLNGLLKKYWLSFLKCSPDHTVSWIQGTLSTASAKWRVKRRRSSRRTCEGTVIPYSSCCPTTFLSSPWLPHNRFSWAGYPDEPPLASIVFHWECLINSACAGQHICSRRHLNKEPGGNQPGIREMLSG